MEKRVGYRDAEAGAEVDSSGLRSDLRCEDAIYMNAISVGGECSSLATVQYRRWVKLRTRQVGREEVFVNGWW